MTGLAIAVPLIWLLWLVVSEWVPLFPLNDLRTDNRRERILAAPSTTRCHCSSPAASRCNGPGCSGRQCGLGLLVIAGHVAFWWLPYFGVSSAAQRAAYQRDYARTLKILPTDGRAVVIDVQHMVVGVLTLAMATTTLLATMAR